METQQKNKIVEVSAFNVAELLNNNLFNELLTDFGKESIRDDLWDLSQNGSFFVTEFSHWEIARKITCEIFSMSLLSFKLADRCDEDIALYLKACYDAGEQIVVTDKEGIGYKPILLESD